jgi:hypothetical protein
MAKIVLNKPVSGFNLAAINANFTAIEAEFQNKVAYRANPTGEPNNLEGNLDVNGKRLYNLGAPEQPTDAIRLYDLETMPVGSAVAAAVSAAQSKASRDDVVNRYRGALGGDPALRPDGTANQVGDEYFSITEALLKRWNGTNWQASDVSTANLISTTGGNLVGSQANATDAVGTTVYKKLRSLELSPFDFLTTAERDDIESGTYAMDNTVALQKTLNACASAFRGRGRPMFLNASYRASSPLLIPAEYIAIVGGGQWMTGIDFTSASGGLKTNAMTYIRPHFEDFYICGGAGTGRALDLSAISGQAYLGNLKNLYLQSGDDAFYAPRFFSVAVTNVAAYSFSGHSFRAQCGPGVSLTSLYALTCGAGKAGYRLGGNINMVSCNGVNSGERWGIFGNDLSSADGWQSDFASNDLPSILLAECNIEEFGVEGLRVQSAFDRFEVQGGKIDRNNLSSAYQSLVHCRSTPNQGTQAARLGFGKVFLGGGTPALGHLYSGGATRFFDTTDKLFHAGVTSFKNTTTTYPILRQSMLSDVYGSNAHNFSSLTARQMSMQTVRYMQPAALNPVGANQAIVVTGYTKVTVTPAATASISTATFDATPNVVSDYGRNGELIIEAGNANLTINHTALGAGGNTYVMKAGANLAMGSGQIAYFVRSSITNQWIQV